MGDQFYRKQNWVRIFKSVQYKKVHNINLKLQVRYEGPHKIVEKVSAAVYVADIVGVRSRVYAVKMRSVAEGN